MFLCDRDINSLRVIISGKDSRLCMKPKCLFVSFRMAVIDLAREIYPVSLDPEFSLGNELKYYGKASQMNEFRGNGMGMRWEVVLRLGNRPIFSPRNRCLGVICVKLTKV